jgi:hypothetical protein
VVRCCVPTLLGKLSAANFQTQVQVVFGGIFSALTMHLAVVSEFGTGVLGVFLLT